MLVATLRTAIVQGKSKTFIFLLVRKGPLVVKQDFSFNMK